MPESRRPVLLLAYANERHDPARYLRDLAAEVRGIRRSLEQQLGSQYLIDVRPNATLDDLTAAFDLYPGQIQLFHYAGHADSLRLMLESGPAGLEGFARLLAQQQGLRFVFLNGCSTAAHGKALAAAGIPAAVGTSAAISDEAAARFAMRFYERLAQGQTLDRAFLDAEIRVQTELVQGSDLRSLFHGEPEEAGFPWMRFGSHFTWRLASGRAWHNGLVVPLLCNRDRQVELFRERLEGLLSGQPAQPHLVVIHGERAERPRSLAERFRRVEAAYFSERHFGAEGGIVRRYEVRDWPSTGDLGMRQRNLLRSLAISLDLPAAYGNGWKAADLLPMPGMRSGTILFQHQISGEKWDLTAPLLLEWYLNEFWGLEAQADGPRILLFLLLTYPAEAPNWLERVFARPNRRQRIQDALYRLESRYPDRVTMLKELKPITYEEVAEWVEEYYPDTLQSLPGELFGADVHRRLPMEQVERKLREAVEALERRPSEI
ncbi:MAG: CHAT domain-containing protein [Bacteroidia bacterium]|nr:CHAT domain-containing protein [Bacteroidia bacterium]